MNVNRKAVLDGDFEDSDPLLGAEIGKIGSEDVSKRSF